MKKIIDVKNNSASQFYGEQKLLDIVLDASKEMKKSGIPYKRIRFTLFGVDVDIKMNNK